MKMSRPLNLARRHWAKRKTKTPEEKNAAAIERLASRVGVDTVAMWQRQWAEAAGNEDAKDALALALLAITPSISHPTIRAVLAGLGSSLLARLQARIRHVSRRMRY